MLFGPVFNTLGIINAVVGVLHGHGDLQSFFQLALVYLRTQKLSSNTAQQSRWTECPEGVLVAMAEDGAGRRAGGDPWRLVAVRYY